MPFEEGNKLGNRFTKDNQPIKNGRPEGYRSRATIAKKWLNTITEWDNPLTGEKEKLSLEDQMTLAQIKAARNDENHQAYKNIMDSAYGAPKQEIEHSGEVEIGFDIGKISDDDLQTILAITLKAKDSDGE